MLLYTDVIYYNIQSVGLGLGLGLGLKLGLGFVEKPFVINLYNLHTITILETLRQPSYTCKSYCIHILVTDRI